MIQSLLNLINAQQNEQKAREAFQGTSWDYFGRSIIEATEKAVDEFEARFDEFMVHRLERFLLDGKIPNVLKTAIENGLLTKLQQRNNE